MRQISALVVSALVCAFSAMSATQPIYINNSPVQVIFQGDVAPQIDATAFVNRSLFQINDIYFTGLPYQTYNTRFFTNTSSATVLGDMGFRFEYSSGNTRAPMSFWLNQGTVSGDTFLLISATNITSTGPLITSGQGVMRLTGGTIKLSGNALKAGAGVSALSSGFNSVSNYFDPDGVSDLYWGTGTNNFFTSGGTPMRLDQGNFDLRAGGFSTPQHQVVTPGPFPFTNLLTLPTFFLGTNAGSDFGAYAFTRTISATSSVVQVVFVRTNSFDTNLSVRVRFGQDADNGADALVEFSYPEFDIINRTFATNYFYFIDSSAFSTNFFLSKNFVATGSRRPNVYNMIRSTSPIFQIQSAQDANTPYTPGLLYNASYASNTVPDLYAAYSAGVSPISIISASGQNIAGTTDPTNYPGRVEIYGDSLNLEQTRIRAESTLVVRAGDLASNKLARVDAPYSVFDLTSHQSQMVVSNFVPASVQRLNGQLYAWSAIWQNAQVTGSSTNQIQFHVLVVDHALQSAFPSQIYRLALHAPHLVIADPVSVGQSMTLDARSMDVTGSLTLPSRANWGNTNVVELYSLTNHGVITVSQTAMVGTDRANPYDNYVNLGTNTAATQLIRVNHFENGGSLVASSGLISIGADTMQVIGVPPVTVTNVTEVFDFTNFVPVLVTNTTIVGAKIQSSSDIGIAANELVMSNAVFQTGANGGDLELSINNHLADAGINAISTWLVGGSFRMLTLPTNGTLLGTHIVSTVPRNSDVFNVWCAQDRGATSSGFSNNLAVAKFTLDAGDFSTIHFSSSSSNVQKALYVDYLELLNFATNVNTQFAIDPNFTIYFANANIAATKLDGAAGGRLRWVKSFTGPFSSTNFTYMTTNLAGQALYSNYVFNTALVTEKNLDSDGDGIVNGDDPTPLYMGESVGLQVLKTKAQPPQVLLRWNALRGVTNSVLYRTNLTLGGWLVLTNVVPPGPFSAPFTARDFLPVGATGAVQRIYRVQVNASP